MFCKYCAFDFSTIPVAPTATVDLDLITTTPKRLSRALLIGGILVLLLVGVIGIWLLKRNSAKADAVSPASVSTLPSTVSEKVRQLEDKVLSGGALTDTEVTGLSAYDLRILRNLHFARYGRKYEKPGLGEYFYTRSWYQPRDDFNENMLTELDKSNIQVIQAAEDRVIVAQSRSWDTFWPMVREAAQKKDRGTLIKLMPADFAYSCCDSYDENNNGETRDEAFRRWSKSEVNGWEELNKALSLGAITTSRSPGSTNASQKRVSPPAANGDKYDNWYAEFELREDGRWYFVSFLVPERDFE